MERRTFVRFGLVSLPFVAAGIGGSVYLVNNLTQAQAARTWPTYKDGSDGEDVYSIQYFLNQHGQKLTADGDFGPKTTAAVKSFQSKQKLQVDSIVGPLTWEKLVVATREGNNGNAVSALQRQLNYQGGSLSVDGKFGPKTTAAVKSFQSKRNIPANGIAEIVTWHQLVVTAPPVAKLRDINSFGSSIEGYAGSDSQDSCGSSPLPGVVAFRDMFLKAFPETVSLGIMRACNSGGTSEHKEGRAWDWGLRVSNPHAQTALNWLFATDKYGHKHAMVRRLGIMYIIWNRKIWSAHRSSEGWRPYSGPNPHTDHIHFSFSWNGARKQTSFWK